MAFSPAYHQHQRIIINVKGGSSLSTAHLRLEESRWTAEPIDD
jgi:hypothetical protein